MSESTTFWDAVKGRRSVYALKNTSPIPDSKIEQLVNDTVLHVPSSFNAQSARVILLLKAEHERFWDIVKDALIGAIGQERYEGHTADRIKGFRAAYGSILFYEDPVPVRALAEKYPTYADKFPQWSEHTSAMHQFVLWAGLEAEGFGANLQHYSPLPDIQLTQQYNIPADWSLKAHLVFGTPTAPAGEKSFEPLEKRVFVHGK